MPEKGDKAPKSEYPLSFFTQKLIAKEPFNDKDLDSLLRAYHEAHTGSTFSEHGDYITDAGVSSYELLAQTIHAGEVPLQVVDLACGDGPLSEIVAQRFPDRVKIFALDMSAGELSAAKRRLNRFSNVEVAQRMADDTGLESGSTDYVLCHMALMLMRPISSVLKEIGRILKTGGTFAAIVPRSDGVPSEIYNRCDDIERRVLEEFIPHFLTIGLSSREVTSQEGMDRLSAEAGCFSAPEYQDINLIMKESPERIFRLFSLYYGPSILPPAGQERLKQSLLTYLESVQDTNGQVALSIPQRKILLKKLPKP